MKLSLPTLLAFLVALPALPSLAQEETGDRDKAFYRVEVIVFTHAGGENDAWPLEQTADYADNLDPAWQAFARRQELDRAEDGNDSASSDLESALSVVDTIASLESGEQTVTEALLYPEPWLALETLSEPMEQARARLERSGAYRTHAWLAWHQPLGDGAQPQSVRIHDDQLIDVDWVTLSATGQLMRDGALVRNVTELAPAFHYRLDGFIRLRQRQFMHADITLDWRAPATVGPAPFSFPNTDADLEVHRLDQSRTIRPDRFEYFDSQWLGLLLRVTPYGPEPSEEEPAAIEEEPESP